MSKVVILITTRVHEAHALGDAWQAAGAPGVTFLEGYGIQSLREASKRVEVLPGMMSMLEMLRQHDENNMIVFSVIPDDAVVDKLVQATERILGSLEQPDNGVMFTLDVDRMFGIRNHD
jgi:hypothetical protein